MQPDKDIIDKVFDTGYSIFHKGTTLANSVKDEVFNSFNGKNVSIEDISPNIDSTEVDNAISSLINSFSVDGLKISISNTNFSKIALTLGISTTSIILFWQTSKLLMVPDYLPQLERECVLIFGDVRDPIVRSQVMDLYRRRYIVFVCSKHAKQYKEKEEEDDFLHHIDPTSSSDLSFFIDFINGQQEESVKLVSILFMPNLSFYPEGNQPTSRIEKEFNCNVLIYYNAIVKLLPYFEKRRTQCILFNPSLSYNLGLSVNPIEIMISSLITGVRKNLEYNKNLRVYTVNVGILRIGGQPSSYKYFKTQGSNINNDMLQPVYKIITYHNGNFIQRFYNWLITYGYLNTNIYCGRYSWLSTLSFLPRFLFRTK